jgi:hypothetical protein
MIGVVAQRRTGEQFAAKAACSEGKQTLMSFCCYNKFRRPA